jgi:hypothetical protein
MKNSPSTDNEMKRILCGLALGVVLGLPLQVHSFDLAFCAEELDRLSRAAASASDAARTAEAKKEDLRSCRKFPDLYDFSRDGCQNKQFAFDTGVAELEGEFELIFSLLDSAEGHCGLLGAPSNVLEGMVKP